MIADKNFQHTTYSAAVYNSVKNAQKMIYVSAFVLSDPHLIKLLIEAHSRGVEIKVIMDPNISPSYSNPNKVQNYNTNLRNFLHTKMLIADK